MFCVPTQVSPRKLYGDFEVAAKIADAANHQYDLDRLPAGGGGGSPDVKPPQLSPTSYLEHSDGFKPFQAPRCARADIPVSVELLLFRRHIAHNQPCPMCDRSLSIYAINIILPCSHIVHPECHEEMIYSGRVCTRCGPSDNPLWDKLLIAACCLNAFR